MKLREALGGMLRQIRQEQGKTLQYIAESANVSLGYLSEIERGQKEVSSEIIDSICLALNIPLWQVMSKVSAVLFSEYNETKVGPELVGLCPHPGTSSSTEKLLAA